MIPDQYSYDLSIVIPVYNDEEVLNELHKRLKAVLPELASKHEVIFIDDGSRDKSFSILKEIAKKDPVVRVIKLARNFGQQNSISAGMDHARGDIIVLMDSDLQDRPEDIHLLLEAMERDDTDMAIAKWITRKDSFRKRFFSKMFYKISRQVTNLKLVPGLGVFRAIRRSAIEQINSIPEKTGTIISLMYWSGFDYSIVELERDQRYAGKSGYNLRKMLKLTADRIFSYSLFPIRVASYLGLIVGGASFLFGIYVLIRRLVFNNIAAGWTSTMLVLAFLFGLNFFFLGVIGEYLGRIYLESKGRPKYIISKIIDNNEE